MSAAQPRPRTAAGEAGRLPTLIWLSWRFLPPLGRADRRTLGSVAVACGYLAMPLTVGLAAPELPAVTLISLLCLAVPALPVWWCGAVPLGIRRRETALTLRQARINTRAAAATSITRLVAYPGLGAVLGAVLITALHQSLAKALPRSAPLAAAMQVSNGRWLLAVPYSAVLLIALTGLLSSARSAACLAAVRRLMARLDHREAAPQPQ
ncbi:MAG TPA: hypothetical protein VH372_24145 [Actinospica sp.]|nr:hypothetical protein [Actinospica sp.]